MRDTIFPLSVSVGVAAGDETCSAHDLLLAAAQAMYRAKASGHGRYTIADDISRPPPGSGTPDPGT